MASQRICRGVLLAVVAAMAVGCTTTTKTTSSTLTTSSPDQKSESERRQDALANYVQVALGYIGQGNRDQARLNLLRALEIDGRSAAAHNGMALLYQLEKDPPHAEEHFRKALRYDSGFTQARNNFGVFLATQKRYQEAFDQFEIASRDVNYNLRPQVFVSLGVMAEKLARPEVARDAWERAIALDPALAGPYLELAEYHFERKDYPLAKRFLNAHGRLAKPSARSLWLEIRVEDAFGNGDGVASKGLALRKLFPYAEETVQYRQWSERRGDAR